MAKYFYDAGNFGCKFQIIVSQENMPTVHIVIQIQLRLVVHLNDVLFRLLNLFVTLDELFGELRYVVPAQSREVVVLVFPAREGGADHFDVVAHLQRLRAGHELVLCEEGEREPVQDFEPHLVQRGPVLAQHRLEPEGDLLALLPDEQLVQRLHQHAGVVLVAGGGL